MTNDERASVALAAVSERENNGTTADAVRFHDGKVILYAGDCLSVIDSLPDNSIDAIVTDPPYHLTSIVKRFGNTSRDDDNDTSDRARRGADGMARLSRGFMGKQWDGGDIAFRPETWAKVLRVLKPGGHMAAFSGTRTYHNMAWAIEQAGFEIRDMMAWCYGTGFPKSHDISKAIDRAEGAEREIIGYSINARPNRVGNETKLSGKQTIGGEITTPATAAARQWQGWGTALKPSLEPIALARKPLSEKTVAANVLRWGCGALNIDACRIATSDKLGGGMVSMGRPKASEGWDRPWMHDKEVTEKKKIEAAKKVAEAEVLGRWPANLCHDGSDEVVAMFPHTGKSVSGSKRANSGNPFAVVNEKGDCGYGDEGSAARFFYSAKANATDRLFAKHPTVKPIDLMRWLVRLITPPNGTVLDCFAGTGTTGHAALLEGFNAVLIEREEEYRADIARRMELALAGEITRKAANPNQSTHHELPLFGAAE